MSRHIRRADPDDSEFLAWAVADRISMRRRTQRPVSGSPPSRVNDLIVLGAGLGLYVGFVLGLHQWLIGVPPIAL